jgi:ZIP family zinc transporter
MVFIVTSLACIVTYLGGLFTLRFKDQLHLILGFSAGAILGVAFFELLPEVVELSGGSSSAIATIGLGFVAYAILDRMFVLHSHDDCEEQHHRRTLLGVSSLVAHRIFDGLAIGFAFNVSDSLGLLVTVAVLIHGFSDGMNVVSLVIRGGGERKSALKYLGIDAFAPFVGVTFAYFVSVSDATMGLILAVFCGFFIYLGASDLLPESHHSHPTRWTTVATVLGMLLLYAVSRMVTI